MKKIISILLVFIFSLLLSSCDALEFNFDNKDDKKSKSTVTMKKSSVEKLCDYIMKNGDNYQGEYKIIYLSDNNMTSISCVDGKKIVFSYFNEGTYNSSSVTLELYEDSVTQTVEYVYEQRGYMLVAEGTLATNLVSYEDCSLSGISYREDFPSSVSQSSIEEIVDMFPVATKAMLARVNQMLIDDVGMDLADLGFENW